MSVAETGTFLRWHARNDWGPSSQSSHLKSVRSGKLLSIPARTVLHSNKVARVGMEKCMMRDVLIRKSSEEIGRKTLSIT